MSGFMTPGELVMTLLAGGRIELFAWDCRRSYMHELSTYVNGKYTRLATINPYAYRSGGQVCVHEYVGDSSLEVHIDDVSLDDLRGIAEQLLMEEP